MFVALVTAVTVGLAPGATVVAAAPTISVDRLGTADVRAHTATIGGRYDCGDERGLAYIEVHLGQRVRRASIAGFGFGVIGACTDERTAGTWTATIPADRGAFRGGPATAIARLVVEPNSLTETTEPVRLVAGCAHRRA
ncbi:hypothetical protein AB0H28_08600 [Micromonospora sp. NPDC050980]|uniref:hypothetical protein n=1 Tax=Micromonospora sp. NPDC050980 TaxID=3155161 RepID=UPI0033E1794A